jgi:hypothetical protein
MNATTRPKKKGTEVNLKKAKEGVQAHNIRVSPPHHVHHHNHYHHQ